MDLFKIFENQATFIEECERDIGTEYTIDELCIPLQRLIKCLEYYQSLNVIKNKENHKIFEKFICEIYTEYLNDFNHLMTIHNNQIYEINQILLKLNTFNKCDDKSCSFTSSHYTALQIEDKSEISGDYKYEFFKQSIDSLHFYLFHLFSFGLRSHNADVADSHYEEKSKGKEISSSIYSDTNHLHHSIRHRQLALSSFAPFKTNRYSKFSMNIYDTTSNTTFTDQLLYVTLQNEHGIDNLVDFIISEDYDTDSLKMDVNQKFDGNINPHNFNATLVQKIWEFIQETQCMNK